MVRVAINTVCLHCPSLRRCQEPVKPCAHVRHIIHEPENRKQALADETDISLIDRAVLQDDGDEEYEEMERASDDENVGG